MAIGFGCYRISNKSKIHRASLKSAIELGVPLIDTSTNYTDGESESLIGEILREVADRPVIVSKVGYIQGRNINLVTELNKIGMLKEDLVKVQDGLWHSIHPDFIRNQIELSLERLGIEKLDVYLLHNPEYYFYESNSTQDEYYRRIEKAFGELEALVLEGKIGEYGISSNNFPLKTDDPKVTNLEKVYQAALNISQNHHFKWIQFPFNLLEIDALEKNYSGLSLVEKANGLDLKTMINRPFNAFKDNQLIRLANYSGIINFLDEETIQASLDACLSLLDERIKADDPENSIHDIPLIKQIVEMWRDLPTPDAVEQVFYNHFFPIVARIWGEDLSAEESQPFYNFFEEVLNKSRQNMDKVANDFKSQAVKSGLLEPSEKSLQESLIEKYESYGFDYILVGMKSEGYVDQLRSYFR